MSCNATILYWCDTVVLVESVSSSSFSKGKRTSNIKPIHFQIWEIVIKSIVKRLERA